MILDEGDFFIETSRECAVPGYLVLRLKGGETGLAELSPAKARELGDLLARAARAVERAAGADRVYVLSFCEVERRLHFHLFPRAPWLLAEYRRANGTAADAVNGPALFAWARGRFVREADLPAGVASGAAIAAAMENEFKAGT
jgi:diadenosine tetraphosphate (Ap4A) HIT family hydrolase